MKRHHVIVGALLGAAALAIVVMPTDRQPVESSQNPLRARLLQTAATYRVREAIAMRLESKYRAQGTIARSGDVVTVRGGDGISARLVERYDSTARALIESLGADRDPKMKLVATLVRDSVVRTRLNRPEFGTGIRYDVFAPGSIRADECHVVVRVFQESGSRADSLRVTRAPFAPCRPYLLFGTPGRGMQAWLATHEYTPLQAIVAEPLSVAATSASSFENRWILYEPRLRACQMGRDEACRAILQRPFKESSLWSWSRTLFPAMPVGWVTGSGNGMQVRWSVALELVLSNMTRELGRDGMRQLWRSDDDFIASLERSAGRPITAVVRNGLQAELDRLGAKAPTLRPLGPLPRPGSFLTLILIVGALIGGAAYTCHRRGGFA